VRSPKEGKKEMLLSDWQTGFFFSLISLLHKLCQRKNTVIHVENRLLLPYVIAGKNNGSTGLSRTGKACGPLS